MGFIAETQADPKPHKALHGKRFGLFESTWKRNLRLISDPLEMAGIGGAAFDESRKKILPSKNLR